jgi:hypothetical protein
MRNLPKKLLFSAAIAAMFMCGSFLSGTGAAAGNFSLQVTPSPLVTTIKPGQTTTLELKIRNAGTEAEDLKIEPRSFTLDNNSEQIKINDTTPPDIAEWISFKQPTFTVQPGAWFTENVKFSLPKNTGFSYSFALVISRQKNPQPAPGGRLIKGSIAVFTLINVDRPGAVRKLDIGSFVVSKRFYEYLPATLSVRFKNTGNTIVQPYGNIFIQHGERAVKPLAALTVNGVKGYILPGSVRTLSAQWSDGFPAYKTTTHADGNSKQQLVWNWSKVSSLRIGHYTAKLVAVYNDGQRDVPIEGVVSFWVVPWKIIIVLLIVLIVLLIGLWSLTRKIIRLFHRLKHHNKPKKYTT